MSIPGNYIISAAHPFALPRGVLSYAPERNNWPAITSLGWQTVTLRFQFAMVGKTLVKGRPADAGNEAILDTLEDFTAPADTQFSMGGQWIPCPGLTTFLTAEIKPGYDDPATFNPNRVEYQLKEYNPDGSATPPVLRLRWNGDKKFPVDLCGFYVGLTNPIYSDEDEDGIPARAYKHDSNRGYYIDEFLEGGENVAPNRLFQLIPDVNSGSDGVYQPLVEYEGWWSHLARGLFPDEFTPSNPHSTKGKIVQSLMRNLPVPGFGGRFNIQSFPGPINLDSDQDGLDDSWEITYFGSPLACDPLEDPDHDSMSNKLEHGFRSGVAPQSSFQANAPVYFPLPTRNDGLDNWHTEIGQQTNAVLLETTGRKYWEGIAPVTPVSESIHHRPPPFDWVGTDFNPYTNVPVTRPASSPSPPFAGTAVKDWLRDSAGNVPENVDPVDADGDGVPDKADAVPYDPNLAFAPVPEARYLLLPLTSGGNPVDGVPVAINDAGHILLTPTPRPSESAVDFDRTNSPDLLWRSPTETVAIPLPDQSTVPFEYTASWKETGARSPLVLAKNSDNVLFNTSWSPPPGAKVLPSTIKKIVRIPDLSSKAGDWGHACLWNATANLSTVLPFSVPSDVQHLPLNFLAVGSGQSYADCPSSYGFALISNRIIGRNLHEKQQLESPEFGKEREEWYRDFSWLYPVGGGPILDLNLAIRGNGKSSVKNLKDPDEDPIRKTWNAFPDEPTDQAPNTKGSYIFAHSWGGHAIATKGSTSALDPGVDASPSPSFDNLPPDPFKTTDTGNPNWLDFFIKNPYSSAAGDQAWIRLPPMKTPIGPYQAAGVNDMPDAPSSDGTPFTTGPLIVGKAGYQVPAKGSNLKVWKSGYLFARPKTETEEAAYFKPMAAANNRGEIIGSIQETAGNPNAFPNNAIWRNGRADLLEDLLTIPKENLSYNGLQAHAINDSGMIAASALHANGQRVPMVMVPVELKMHPILSDGTISPESTGIQTSLPSPEVEVSNLQLGNLRTDASGRIIADITLSGEVTSHVCDTIKGIDGEINSLEFYVNGEADEEGGGFASVDLTIAKQENGPVSRPYPYSGTFSGKVIHDVPLVDGVNTFEISAQDKIYGNPGYSRWSVSVTVAQPDPETAVVAAFNLTASMVADTPLAQVNQVTVTYTAGSLTASNQSFLRDTAYSGDRFTATIGGVPHFLEMDESGTPSPSKRDNLAAVLRIGGASNPGYRINLLESQVASGSFLGTYQSYSVAGSPGPVILEKHGETARTNGGEFHSYAVELKLPEGIPLGASPTIKMGDQEFKVKTHQASGLLLVQHPQDPDKPVMASCRSTEEADPPTSAEEQKILDSLKNASFAEGLAKGIYGGGKGLVVGTKDLVMGVGERITRQAWLVGIFLKVGFFGESEDGSDTAVAVEIDTFNTRDYETALSVVEALKPLGELVLANAEVISQMQLAMLAGNHQGVTDAWAKGGKVNEKILSYAAEAISNTLVEFDDAGPGVKGYRVGQVVFEAVMILIPAASGTKLANLTKSEFLLKLGPKLKGAAQTAASVLRSKLLTTKMCFVAGTPIHTQEGLKNIEAIQPGDLVWSRNEFTGEYGWRPVVETFVTHPSEVHHLTYIVRGPPGGRAKSETLGVTAPHPFWVQNRPLPTFLPAGELKTGDILSLANEGTAEVLARTVEKALGGQTFTTYNFEVAGFHTYFAGKNGVWVHNVSKSPCDEVFSAFYALTVGVSAKFQGRPWAGFDEVARSMGKGRNSAIFGWAADEVMRVQLRNLPLAERIAQWPSHNQIRATMGHVFGPTKNVDLYDVTNFGYIDVPDWLVQERIDLQSVKSFKLESHHGVPKKLQEWLGLNKDKDSVPAYLTTMLEHRGAGEGIHQKLSVKLGEMIETGPINLNLQSIPPGLTPDLM